MQGILGPAGERSFHEVIVNAMILQFPYYDLRKANMRAPAGDTSGQEEIVNGILLELHNSDLRKARHACACR